MAAFYVTHVITRPQADVSEALDKYAEGQLSADDFIAAMRDMGVEVLAHLHQPSVLSLASRLFLTSAWEMQQAACDASNVPPDVSVINAGPCRPGRAAASNRCACCCAGETCHSHHRCRCRVRMQSPGTWTRQSVAVL